MKTEIDRTTARRNRLRMLFKRALPCVLMIALFVAFPQPAHAGVIEDIVNSIEESICSMLLGAASWALNLYFDIIGAASSTSYITGSFSSLFGTNAVWGAIETIHETAIIPLGESLLALFIMIQFIKISQRMDATATLPAIKDIVVLAVFYVIFHWLIINSLGIVTAIFDEFNAIATSIGESGSARDFLDGELDLVAATDLGKASVGGCFMLALFSILSVLVGAVAYVAAFTVSAARAVQLYVMAAFSPIPLSLLGFDETRQMGIGYLKNFCAAALAGAIIMLLLAVYPSILSSVLSNVDAGSLAGIVEGYSEGVLSSFLKLLEFLAMSFLFIFGISKSGAWARDILGG